MFGRLLNTFIDRYRGIEARKPWRDHRRFRWLKAQSQIYPMARKGRNDTPLKTLIQDVINNYRVEFERVQLSQGRTLSHPETKFIVSRTRKTV